MDEAYPAQSRLRARFAVETIKDQIREDVEILNIRRREQENLVEAPDLDPSGPVPELKDLSIDDGESFSEAQTDFNVGIIGAGMTGLYTAMILKSLGIKYEILEASKRPGGRVYTHYFDEEKRDGDYYDVGAMRFPKIPIMRRTFDLFDRVGIRDNTSTPPTRGSLIPYYLSGPNTPLLYNNIKYVPPPTSPGSGGSVKQEDIFKVSETNHGTVPDKFVQIGANEIIKKMYQQWRDGLSNPGTFEETWRALLALDAQCVSTRSQLFNMLRHDKGNMDYTDKQLTYVTNWCESMGGSTGSFDEGFIGNLIHSLEFEWPATPHMTHDPVPEKLGNVWRCINGGTDYLTQAMIKKVETPLYGQKVRRIKYEENHDCMEVEVVHAGAPAGEIKNYSHVFNTTTLGCLQIMDTTAARLTYAHREAIRTLGYAQAVKMGIRFKRRWWADDLGIKQGGQGKTDRPTRVVVYPSYALDTEPGQPGVLLACYNSAEDAARLGSIIDNTNKTPQELVYSIIIADLAAMHGRSESELIELTDTYHVHSWYGDEHTLGAWGSLGPGHYSTFFGRIQRPAGRGHLFLAGEFSSIYPGWIVGSLNSAYRAVGQMLTVEIFKAVKRRDTNAVKYLLHLIGNLQNEWGGDLSEFEPGFEMRGDDGWQVYLGIIGAEVGL